MNTPRQYLINKLKDMEFYFDSFQGNTDLWKQKGTRARAAIPREPSLDDLYVHTVLAIAGCSEEEIRDFLTNSRLI